MQANIAESRMQIEQARLLTMKAAWMMDTVGKKNARTEIAAIKVVAARVATDVIDRAIQLFGGAGVTDDWPLASMYAHARTLHLVDGPDEVHLRQIAATSSASTRTCAPPGSDEGPDRVRAREPAAALGRRARRAGRRARAQRASTRCGCRSASAAPRPTRCSRSRSPPARTKKIKLGTSVSVLPGRSPALVAKEWATLDVLSGGRALPAFGLGIVHPVEQQAFGVERGDRASIFDEALPLLRRLWAEDDVDHDGRWFHYEHMNVLPKPAHPLDVWLGGNAPSELRRVGRLADGWLASFTTPEQCKAARVTVEERRRRRRNREIDPEHFGVMALYTHDAIPDAIAQAIKTRNPDVEIDDLVARAGHRLHDLCALHRGRLLEARARAARRAARLGRRARSDGRGPAPVPGRSLVRLSLEEAAQADDRADHADPGADHEHEECRYRARRRT